MTAGLHDLLTRPWYDRLWIIQEVWGAEDVTFQCGQFTLHWSQLEATVEFMLQSLTQYDASFSNPFIKIVRCSTGAHNPLRRASTPDSDSTRDPEDRPPLNDLLHVIQRTSSSMCSNPRDYIYGILGMTDVRFQHSATRSDNDGECLRINYDLSIREVYVDVVKILLRRRYFFGELVKLVSAAPQVQGQQLLGGQIHGEALPSWCPNWSVPFEFRFPSFAWKPRKDAPSSSYVRDDTVLCVRGTRVGSIDGYLGPGHQACIRTYSFSLKRIKNDSMRMQMIFENCSDFRDTKAFGSVVDFVLLGPMTGDIVVITDNHQFALVLRTDMTSGHYELITLMPIQLKADSDVERRILYAKFSAVNEPFEQFNVV